MKFITILSLTFLLFGCKDKYQEGYQSGYVDGVIQTENRLKKEYEEKLQDQKVRNRSFSVYSTEVCGGGGVNVNQKHYEGGKTGCVRVYSDGRVERY